MAPLVDTLDAIRLVADRLGPLLERVVFLGGATVGLLVGDQATVRPRSTKDVDVVIEVTTWWDYQGNLRDQLLEHGFREDTSEEAPMCRWVINGIRVDIMPTQGGILGLTSSWFQAAFTDAVRHQLQDGPAIRLVTPPCFLATKLEAFGDRGHGDFRASEDIEDIVAVIDGRSSIADEIGRASSVREYVAREVRRYLGEEAFVEALAGHLPPDGAGQGRLPDLIARLQDIASMLLK